MEEDTQQWYENDETQQVVEKVEKNASLKE